MDITSVGHPASPTQTNQAFLDQLVAERNDRRWWSSPNPTDAPEQCSRRRSALLQALVGFKGPKQVTAATRRRRATVQDVTFMLDTGCSTHEICRRLDTNAPALARALRRYGRDDLARPFGERRAA